MSSFPDKLLISCRKKKEKRAALNRDQCRFTKCLIRGWGAGEQCGDWKKKMCFKAYLPVCPQGVYNSTLCAVCLHNPFMP